jgi:hypothetical protein
MTAFFVIVSALWLLFHALVALRLVPRVDGRTARLRLVLWLVLGLLSAATLAVDRFLAPGAARVYRWIGWTYIGGFSTLFALLVARALVLAIGRRWARSERGQATIAERAPTLASPERRAFIARASATGSFGVTAALTGYGLQEARRLPEVVEVEVPIRGLPKRFDGYHIVQLSDVHVGLTIDKDTILPIVERVTSLGADLVVVTGDIIDGSLEALRDDATCAPATACCASPAITSTTSTPRRGARTSSTSSACACSTTATW